jgi:hypothetical protein
MISEHITIKMTRKEALAHGLLTCGCGAEGWERACHKEEARAIKAEAKVERLKGALRAVLPFAEAAVDEAAGWAAKDEQDGRIAVAAAHDALAPEEPRLCTCDNEQGCDLHDAPPRAPKEKP